MRLVSYLRLVGGFLLVPSKEATGPMFPISSVVSHHFGSVMVATMTWLTVTEYICVKKSTDFEFIDVLF
jgi:hypothetical protein